MIAFLSGEVLAKRPGALVVNTGAIGFEIRVAPQVLLGSKVGETVSLNIRMQVREDEISLYGFLSELELSLFDKLCSVSGIGPKVALAALGALSPDDLVRAITEADETALTAIPGVGTKTAKQLLLSLTGKVALETPASEQQSQSVIDGLTGLGVPLAESVRLVKSALENLGGNPGDAELLREALRIRRG